MNALLNILTVLVAYGAAHSVVFSGAELRPAFRLMWCATIFLCGVTVGMRVYR